ncbi:ABC-2 type transport system permease protein [Azospirillum lipoferum]|uniref:ABC transporter permease n=1 Tax=Azospirillum lipoferum TaxID=193 RepID=A0A5A9GX40_AZOLI|nr:MULTISPECIES: ABC transporter permease [Azospirillum]KAA0598134.1 ABC transporter permease [Azospirillum lipoferum]MCP1613743.1 ABC-2 type transport system permease protein [Azospirillum lipoferum]MDW5534805.1 ABC transporter permease [Azospirillum sp. NL1]
MARISAGRLMAVMVKEFIQMRRDRLTFAMMVGVPILQLILFGFAINSDPKALPTAVLVADSSPFARTLVAAMENSRYFAVTRTAGSEGEIDRLLAEGEVQFAVTIPTGFARDLQRGTRPVLLVEADATDPAATSNALSALTAIARQALNPDLTGPLVGLRTGPDPVELRVHRRYNPEGITQYNVVPGLMGVVLTMTMVMMTALAVTRERERGTMENLLAMPVRPFEVMLGKIVPFVVVGYVQVLLIVVAARLLFDVPIVGSLGLLSAVLILFIAANLAVGFTFSTLARNQLQAMQMSFFFFLPSMLLSGFMFPFRGMPGWAQAVGEILPLTHFLRIVRGILLKGNGLAEIATEVLALALFLTVVTVVALKRYRQTLD